MVIPHILRKREDCQAMTNDNDLEKFNTVLRKVLSVPREELVRREQAWKKEQARKKQARISPASRASTLGD
jgi:hypothetical protein